MSNYINAILDSVNENNSVELFNSDAINEVLLQTDRKEKYSLHIDPTPSYKAIFINDPYVKVYDSISYNTAKSCIRVHIFKPYYEYHNDRFKKLEYSISIANFLNTAMGMQSLSKDYPGVVSESLLKVIEVKCNLTPEERVILRSHKIIDFTEIKP